MNHATPIFFRSLAIRKIRIAAKERMPIGTVRKRIFESSQKTGPFQKMSSATFSEPIVPIDN